jgi:hypothetical protein
MQISRIRIKNYKQFGYLDLDLTYPVGHEKEGLPLEKVCFIGKNGTGKTTILEFIRDVFRDHHNLFSDKQAYSTATWGVEFVAKGKKFFVGKIGNYEYEQGPEKKITGVKTNMVFIPYEMYDERVDLSKMLDQIFIENNLETFTLFEKFNNATATYVGADTESDILDQGAYNNGTKLLIYSPIESENNNTLKTSWTELATRNDAVPFLKNLPFYHEVSFKFIKEFWALIISQTLEREDRRRDFEMDEKNINKTKKELLAEFDALNPDFLKVLDEKWTPVLGAAGLYFDYKGAKRPVQLENRLDAFIRLKSTNEIIPFNTLSSGIKYFIFRLGYLHSLYYQREISDSVVLFDEPENSFFPDVQYSIIDIYANKTDFPNTQFFFATHSPIIASQFEKEERIILEFDEENKVRAKKGKAPRGDDPNDVLEEDFGRVELMPQYGELMFKEFKKIKRLIESDTNVSKEDYEKFIELGNKYNFPVE